MSEAATYVFGRNVRLLLTEQGMTQRELAQQLGVTVQSVNHQLNRARGCGITLATLQRYAEVLDVPAQTLIDPGGVTLAIRRRRTVRLEQAGEGS